MNSKKIEKVAKAIVAKAGGDVGECRDWLSDGDPDGMSIKELVKEWKEAGCSYIA